MCIRDRGEEVLLKRNFGPHPKISVNWKKGPYIVTKKIGPVNYAIKNPKGIVKVIHHDNLMPVRKEHEASRTARYELSPDLVTESSPVIATGGSTCTINSENQRPLPQIDRSAFTQAVLNIPRNQIDNLNNQPSNPVSNRTSTRQINQTEFFGVNQQAQADFYDSMEEF